MDPFACNVPGGTKTLKVFHALSWLPMSTGVFVIQHSGQLLFHGYKLPAFRSVFDIMAIVPSEILQPCTFDTDSKCGI